MLNPDGVVAGNYRTSLAGADLNRKFDQPDYRLHPTVWNIKRMTEQICDSVGAQNCQFYIDMHGHSRRKNVFIYGPQLSLSSSDFLNVRVLPKLLQEETEMFRYHSCSFQNEKSKETAARISLFREFGILNCFTLEASFHGWFDRDRVTHEFDEKGYEQMGAKLVTALYTYVMASEEDERRREVNRQLRKKRVRGALREQKSAKKVLNRVPQQKLRNPNEPTEQPDTKEEEETKDEAFRSLA